MCQYLCLKSVELGVVIVMIYCLKVDALTVRLHNWNFNYVWTDRYEMNIENESNKILNDDVVWLYKLIRILDTFWYFAWWGNTFNNWWHILIVNIFWDINIFNVKDVFAIKLKYWKIIFID